MQQYTFRKQIVRRPVGARYEDRYTIETMKHPLSIMVWGAMSAHGTGALYFLQLGTIINAAKYLDLFNDKLEIHMMVHDCNVFVHDGAPCHKAKSVKNFLQEKNFDILDWQGNSLDLNQIENLRHVMKNEVAEQHPNSTELLKLAIKILWTQKMTSAYCCNFMDSLPHSMAAMLNNRGGFTKYQNNKVNDFFFYLWGIICLIDCLNR